MEMRILSETFAMRIRLFTLVRGLAAALMAIAVVLVAPTAAFGWAAWSHANLTEDTVWSMSPEQLNGHGVVGYPYIERSPDLRPIAILPELDDHSMWWIDAQEPGTDLMQDRANWDWVKLNSMEEDSYALVPWGDGDAGLPDWAVDWAPASTWPNVTIDHFWNLDGNILNSVKGVFADTYPNSWMKAKLLWAWTLGYWNSGDLGNAYAYLGHVTHLLEDQGIACHAHDDWHPPMNDDSLEEWFKEIHRSNLLYSWSGQEGRPTPPGGVLFPPSNEEVMAVALDITKGMVAAPDPDVTPGPSNVPQLFYLMYTVNQYGDFSPSDDYDGDTFEPTGWCDYGDPEIRWTNNDDEPLTGDGSMVTLSDNDSDPDNNNIDGDLTTILRVGWRAAFRAAPALIDLFRRTVDAVPPVTNFGVTRADGAPLREWNNSIVTVTLSSAEDGANPGYRASGIWKRWGLCDGLTPSFTPAPDETPYWAISGDGVHAVQLMATDKMGNVEWPANDFSVKVDLTPPVIAFPDLRPNYLTSQTFTATWNAYDATSGVASEVAYLDGNLVSKGQVFNLAQMAGLHSLRVIVYDNAENYTDVVYGFEVWIDANGWCLPVNVNSKTQGEGLTCVVEFPPFYDVGIIVLDTTRLAVKGYVDLHEQDPILGQTAYLPGLLLTGVGDHDRDGVRDRKIKFDKALFVQALGGQTGDVPSVIRGGLLPNGLPHFLAPVVVPVFKSPK
jgi:hypothetical protein